MHYFNSIAIDGSNLAGLSTEELGWDELERANHEAERYELRVLEIILKIVQTETGRAVFRDVERVSASTPDVFSWKSMVIKPNSNAPGRDPYPGANKAVNAYATPSDWAAATPKGKVFSSESYVDNKGVLRHRKLRGTGEGSDTVVEFTPQHFVFRSINLRIGITNPPFRFQADEFLLHEVVHGLRQMSGLMYQKRVPFQKGYDNIEEFFAVLIANIYRSECDRKELRKDHGKDFIEMSEAEFIRTGMNRSHLRQLRHQHPTLFSDLRDIDSPFNPTRRILDI